MSARDFYDQLAADYHLPPDFSSELALAGPNPLQSPPEPALCGISLVTAGPSHSRH